MERGAKAPRSYSLKDSHYVWATLIREPPAAFEAYIAASGCGLHSGQ